VNAKPIPYAVSVAGRRDIERLQHEVEELIADLWQVPRFSGLHHGFRPQVDCFQTADPPELTVVVELPGVDPHEVQVVASGRALVVAGERRRPRYEGAVSYSQMEIEEGPFHRQIALPTDVDPAGARASYDRGLLTVVLPVVQQRPTQERVSIEVTRT
jgi:HSP20 family protein